MNLSSVLLGIFAKLLAPFSSVQKTTGVLLEHLFPNRVEFFQGVQKVRKSEPTILV
jgi:hypothetical protein